jgi:hypothetical protein
VGHSPYFSVLPNTISASYLSRGRHWTACIRSSFVRKVPTLRKVEERNYRE